MYVTVRQTRWLPGVRRLRTRGLLPWAMLLILMAGAAAVLGRSGAWSAEPDIVARMNGEPVTRGEVRRLLADPLARRELQRELGVREPDRKDLERLAIQKLINRRLLLQEAVRRNIRVTQDDLSQATAALRGRFQDLKALGAWMKARGLDDVSLQDLLAKDLLMNRVLALLVEGVRLPAGQVEEYYAAHNDELKAAEAIHLRIIAVKDKTAAEEIAATLKQGVAFDRLARERSAVRAEQGGELGWVSPARLQPALREAVKPLKAGETSPPLALGEQFLLVRLEERRPAHTLSLAEARPGIERRLLAPKQQEVVQAWLKEQEKKAKIEVFIQPGSFTTGAVNVRSND
jgi:parvulin-like peptidyl-prolyl isomerase